MCTASSALTPAATDRTTTKSTADRDAAFAVLDKWQKIFERLARTTLKSRPDLLKKLNL